MEFNLNAKRPWRFISRLMQLGWRLEDTTEVNRGFFQLVKFGSEGTVRQLFVVGNVVTVMPPASAGSQP